MRPSMDWPGCTAEAPLTSLRIGWPFGLLEAHRFNHSPRLVLVAYAFHGRTERALRFLIDNNYAESRPPVSAPSVLAALLAASVTAHDTYPEPDQGPEERGG